MQRSKRLISLSAIVAMIAALLAGVQLAGASRTAVAQADASNGSGGAFVPFQGRILDTRNGTGGISSPIGSAWQSVPVEGAAGLPSTGIAAVEITLSALNPSGAGYLETLPDSAHRPTTYVTSQLNYDNGVSGPASATAITAVGSDGDIMIRASVATDVTIDVQGYYTPSTGTAGSGFTPITPTRLVDTRSGIGGTTGPLSTGATPTFQATGVDGIPANATALFVTFSTYIPGSSPAGYIQPYPSDAPPNGSQPNYTAYAQLNYPAAGPSWTSLSATVDLSASGSFSVYVNGPSVQVIADVMGYFSSGSGSSFTPANARLLLNQSIASTGTYTLQVTGADTGSQPSGAVTAAALDLGVDSTSGGNMTVWPADQSKPLATAMQWGSGTETRNNSIAVELSSTGAVSIYNEGGSAIKLTVDLQGWYGSVLPEPSGANCASAGSRSAQKMVSHKLNDRESYAYNPVTGNANLTGDLLHLTGIDQDVDLSWRYNSINDVRPTLDVGGYEDALEQDTNGGSNFTYTAPDGGCYDFTVTTAPATPAKPPAGINATLTNPSSGHYTLQFWPSGVKYNYVLTNGAYLLSTSTDKYSSSPNTITYTYSGTQLTKITDTQGRVVTFAYNDPNNSSQPSSITDTSLSRTINIVYGGPAGAMSKITDAAGAVTTFGYNTAGQISSVTDGNGDQTTFSYAGPGDRVTGWTYGAGTSDAAAFQAAYPSSTSTTITDPNSHVTTYTLNTSASPVTVSRVTDPLGHHSDVTVDTHDNTLTADDGLDGSNGNSADQTTAGYGNASNTNNMLSSVSSPASASGQTPASSSETYPTSVTGGIADYEPTGSKDAQGNTSTYGYTSGDMTSSSSGSGADTASTTTTYQGDGSATCTNAKQGEVCTKKNGNGDSTSYSYDSSGNVTTITLPSPLGARHFSYDAAGRVTAAGDGRGDTAFYSYDGDDRVTQVTYSNGSCGSTCVTYTYDADGNLTARTDPTGTTGLGYDHLNRPTTKTFTPAGSSTAQTLSTATYDGASNLVSYTDPAGTVHYIYDDANELRGVAEPGGSCPSAAGTGTTPIDTEPKTNSDKCTWFKLDADGRRINVYYPDGQSIGLTYDHAGRATRINALDASGNELGGYAYTYVNGSKDQDLRNSSTNLATNAVTTYTYDSLDRLKTAVTGSTTYAYGYDKDGNMTSRTEPNANGQSQTYTYNAADELSDSAGDGYDGTGNELAVLTRHVGWARAMTRAE